MHVSELDTLLDGAEGVTVTLTNGERVSFTRLELACGRCFRRVMRAAGYEVPRHSQARHDEVVRALIELSHADQLMPAA